MCSDNIEGKKMSVPWKEKLNTLVSSAQSEVSRAGTFFVNRSLSAPGDVKASTFSADLIYGDFFVV